MAIPRSDPYMWVTWLSKIMSGQTACQWQGWFQTHNQLTERHPQSFDLTGWKINHTRMLTELVQKMTARGLEPRVEFPFTIAVGEATLGGKIDCLVVENSIVQVYDCKTGTPRDSDVAQVMIYMHALSRIDEFKREPIQGTVLYKEHESVEIPELPDTFASNFDFFVNLLSADTPAVKVPGHDCKFCSIAKSDCAERVDEGSES